jgi:HAD superfamily hydrolase (TIGR01549 family)
MFTVPNEVTSISFDIWSTLLYVNKAGSRPRLRLIFDFLGFPETDIDLLWTAYLEADGFYNDEAERTGQDYGMAERLGSMFKILGIASQPPQAQTIRKIQALVATQKLRPEYLPTLIEPDLPATLEALRNQGYTLGLLSNTGMNNSQVMEPILKALGIWHFFDVAVFSSDDGRAKPNPDLFRYMARRLGTVPRQTLHVGDNIIADYRATEAGLHAVLFAPRGSHLPHIRSTKDLLGH